MVAVAGAGWYQTSDICIHELLAVSVIVHYSPSPSGLARCIVISLFLAV